MLWQSSVRLWKRHPKWVSSFPGLVLYLQFLRFSIFNFLQKAEHNMMAKMALYFKCDEQSEHRPLYIFCRYFAGLSFCASKDLWKLLPTANWIEILCFYYKVFLLCLEVSNISFFKCQKSWTKLNYRFNNFVKGAAPWLYVWRAFCYNFCIFTPDIKHQSINIPTLNNDM